MPDLHAQKIAKTLQVAIDLKACGRLTESVRAYEHVIELDPFNAANFYNLGNLYKQLENRTAAIDAYQRALRLDAELAEAHFNLANLYMVERSASLAVGHYQRVTELWPNFATAFSNLGNAWELHGNIDRSFQSHRRAVELAPGNDHFLTNFGSMLINAGLQQEAQATLMRAISINPSNARAYSNLGLSYFEEGRFLESLVARARAREISPKDPDVLTAYGRSLVSVTRIPEGLQAYRDALQLNPRHEVAGSNLLFTLAYSTNIPPLEYLEESKQVMASCWASPSLQPTHDFVRPDSKAPLKVAYISGDFREHAVMYFMKSIIANHDQRKVELHAYSNSHRFDKVTEQIQAAVQYWTDITGWGDEEVYSHIRSRGINVLIDLSGHNAGNRLGVFARRAAPVQAHYLGYFATTGLAEMDYWIGDAIITPESSDIYFAEQVWRLPRTWISYQGEEAAPPPMFQRRDKNRFVFGSFNQLEKLTSQTIELWSRLLKTVSGSKLLIKTKALKEPGNVQTIQEKFSVHGITSNQLDLRASVSSWCQHMATYDEIDVALDPIGGVGGGTTSCDALWMGVPVVTFAGECVTHRMTASLLDAIGCQEWIANSTEHYIEIATNLVNSIDKRYQLKVTLREHMRKSPLCNTILLTRALEDAYFEMNQKYWENQTK